MEIKQPKGEFFDYIDINSVDNKNNIILFPKHILPQNAPSRAAKALFGDSVVFSLVRPCLRNIAYINKWLSHCIASTGFYICTSNGIFYPPYMFLLLISNYTVLGLNQFIKGDHSPSIRKDDMKHWLFPIPPYNEQIKISQKRELINCNLKEIKTNL